MMLRASSKRRHAAIAAVLAALALMAGALFVAPAGAASNLDPLALARAQRANCQVLLAHSKGLAQADRAKDCISDQTVIINTLVSATPTATATRTPTPAPTTTPPPTTPPPTTAPPTTTTGPVIGCLPRPSSCGYPDPTNTGVPVGTLLQIHAGNYYAQNTGEVITNMEITGCLYVGAANVTVRNSKIGTANDCYYTVRDGVVPAEGTWTGLTITDTEIRLAALSGAYGVSYDNYTLTRVRFTEAPGNPGADCAYGGHNVVIQDSYCELGVYQGDNFAPGAPHFDGFSSSGGDGIRLTHDTFINPNPQNSAILMSTNDGAIKNVVIDNNLVNGGNYIVYCGTDTGGTPANETLTNNRFGRNFRFGATTHCDSVAVNSGNVFDDTGSPVI